MLEDPWQRRREDGMIQVHDKRKRQCRQGELVPMLEGPWRLLDHHAGAARGELIPMLEAP